MWMLSFSPSWKRIENSFSPINLARPSVAATFPAVSEASDVASTFSRSPLAAICWPFLSTRKTIFALESVHRRVRIEFDLVKLLLVHHKNWNPTSPYFRRLRPSIPEYILL